MSRQYFHAMDDVGSSAHICDELNASMIPFILLRFSLSCRQLSSNFHMSPTPHTSRMSWLCDIVQTGVRWKSNVFTSAKRTDSVVFNALVVRNPATVQDVTSTSQHLDEWNSPSSPRQQQSSCYLSLWFMCSYPHHKLQKNFTRKNWGVLLLLASHS